MEDFSEDEEANLHDDDLVDEEEDVGGGKDVEDQLGSESRSRSIYRSAGYNKIDENEIDCELFHVTEAS